MCQDPSHVVCVSQEELPIIWQLRQLNICCFLGPNDELAAFEWVRVLLFVLSVVDRVAIEHEFLARQVAC